MADQMLEGSEVDELQRRNLLLWELYERERLARVEAETTLREVDDLGGGDDPLGRLVLIWRARAERDGTLRALAERVCRLLENDKPTRKAVAEWRAAVDGTKET